MFSIIPRRLGLHGMMNKSYEKFTTGKIVSWNVYAYHFLSNYVDMLKLEKLWSRRRNGGGMAFFTEESFRFWIEIFEKR